ncbi:MAG: hypothetical protein RIT28_2862, partial [Pseudomonadota bacterium]
MLGSRRPSTPSRREELVLSTPRPDADDDALDLLRVEVAVVPASSQYAALVREVAARAGAAFV